MPNNDKDNEIIESSTKQYLPFEEEVARIMGVSTGTARVYRCKAVQLLAAWMNKEESS